MSTLLHLLQGTQFLNNKSLHGCSSIPFSFQRVSFSCDGHYIGSHIYRGVRYSLQVNSEVIEHVDKCSLQHKAKIVIREETDVIPHVQTLRKFPREELFAKVVMVRFDSSILLGEETQPKMRSVIDMLSTIRYLYEAGAKVILVGNWSPKSNPMLLLPHYVADVLSSALQLKVVPEKHVSGYRKSMMEELKAGDIVLLENLSESKWELANCLNFAEQLASGVDIFVSDDFSQSHKILASTVGVSRFCYTCLAGFHVEECLYQLKNISTTNENPYYVVIGGGNLFNKASAMHFLASRCDGLVFVGMMAFTIIQVLGLPVPLNFVERGALKVALELIEFAQRREIPIIIPKDFWCTNTRNKLELFPARGILNGWEPIDIGPNSFDEIDSFLQKSKKLVWIGPLRISSSNQDTSGESKWVLLLDKLTQSNCDITVVGNMAVNAIVKESSCPSVYNMFQDASVLWGFLSGRKLPGLTALDRAYPFAIDWDAAYHDPTQRLVVDIGSGNGLFLLGMAKKRKDLNFLGLETNEKLVKRCLDSAYQSGIKNGYFIETNATSTFRSIVSSYPGELVLVSIQCPNPDFNKPEHRWSMLQRSLAEAVTDLLACDGKVFLQSDIEAVALRMKQQFLKYGKDKLVIFHSDSRNDHGGWLEENPFGVRSDWEQHVIDRGQPMYRLMLSKSTT